MKDEVLAHLHDILQGGQAIKGFISGKTFEEYSSDELLRSAVERKFEIMGEAINTKAVEHVPYANSQSDGFFSRIHIQQSEG